MAGVKVYEILYDVHPNGEDCPFSQGCGAAGDCTVIHRTRSSRDAQAFAKANTVYGRPITLPVEASIVPRRLASRWGLA